MAKKSGLEALINTMRVRDPDKDLARVRIDVGSTGTRRQRIAMPETATNANAKDWQESEPGKRFYASRPKPPPAPKRGKGKQKPRPPKMAAAPASIDTVKNPFDGKPQRVHRRNEALRRLRKINISDGQYLWDFQADNEAFEASLRSPSLDGAGGGGPVDGKVPLRAIEGARRIRVLRDVIGEGRYALAVLFLNHGVTVEELHENGADQHVVTSGMVRDAFRAIEDFYQPGTTRRTYIAAQRMLEMRVKGVRQ